MHSIKLKGINKKGTTLAPKTVVEIVLWVLAFLALVGLVILLFTGSLPKFLDGAFAGIKSIFQGL
jgi:hypothetical protein